MEEEYEYDYGSWLTEDLRSLYKQTLKDREKAEIYSDRALLNLSLIHI